MFTNIIEFDYTIKSFTACVNRLEQNLMLYDIKEKKQSAAIIYKIQYLFV